MSEKKYGSFKELGEARGLRQRRPDEKWAAPRKAKFLKCPACGKEMTFTVGTNIVICKNENETPTGVKTCGFRRILNDTGYADYLFS